MRDSKAEYIDGQPGLPRPDADAGRPGYIYPGLIDGAEYEGVLSREGKLRTIRPPR